MADVFISYHEKSAGELAAQIAAALESAGISCWYAKRDIPPGGAFAEDIPSQIDACKVFLLILNESVYQSKHIENELGLAFSRLNKGEHITILPLEIGDFKQESWVKYYLIQTQSVKIPCLDEAHVQDVTQKISNILDKKSAPMEKNNSITSNYFHKLEKELRNIKYRLHIKVWMDVIQVLIFFLYLLVASFFYLHTGKEPFGFFIDAIINFLKG